MSEKEIEENWKEAWEYLYEKYEEGGYVSRGDEMKKQFSGELVYKKVGNYSPSVLYDRIVGEDQYLNESEFFLGRYNRLVKENLEDHIGGPGYFHVYFTGTYEVQVDGLWEVEFTRWMVKPKE
jgi:hypothetical protein